MYQSMWQYSDIWGFLTKGQGSELGVEDSNVETGFDVVRTGDHVYAVQAFCNASQTNTSSIYTNGLNNLVFVTFARTLIIQPDGIILEA